MLVIKFIVLLSFLSLHISHLVNGGDESVIIVSLPQTSSELSMSWERGEEILPGAMVASNRINNDSHLNVSLKRLVVDSGQVTKSGYSYSGNMLETIATLALQDRLDKIAGIAGVLHPNMLLTLKSSHLSIASLVHFGVVPCIPDVYYMTASTSVVADSIALLMGYFDVDTMGMITDVYHWYYVGVSNQLSKVTKISLYIQIGRQRTKYSPSKVDVTSKVSRSSARVIFVAANPSASTKVLCEAYKAGLKWPKYAWILLSFPFNDRYQHMSEDCSTQDILEGILILELAQAESGITHTLLSGNPFAYLLHEAIWKLALAATTANHTLSSQLNGPLLHQYSKVYVYQVLNGTLNPSGVYESESQSLSNVTVAVSIDHHKLSAPLPLHYLMILPTLCFVFNTLLLVSFFCFRNAPDVKSTTVSLSLLMFIGCYLLVIYIVVLLVGENLNFDLCMVRVSGLSLCLPLIQATVLVKMLRIYRVFTLHGYEKPSIFLYNCALFVYTLLIIAPKVCVVILWSSIDTYHRKDFSFVDSSGFTIVQTKCSSNYTFMWTMFLVVYDVILSVAVVTIAIRTRKVRFARFKDTKKVNLMVFLVLFVGVSTWLYWYVFTATGLYHLLPIYILYAGSITIPFICQFTLFVPKVWTPLRKRLRTLRMLLV